MAVQMERNKQTAGKWSTVFPVEQFTEQQSFLFIKKLLAVAISNITYLRSVFPDHAFGDRRVEDLSLKILRDDNACPGACQVIKWVRGCFDALDKKYLRTIIMGLYKDENDTNSMVESYTFKFSYDGDGISIYRNGEKLTGAKSAEETRKATIKLLRTIIVLTQALPSLPDNVMMTMKLLYYDDVTPADYEPPGFKASYEDLDFINEPTTINVGEVQTPFHEVKVRVSTKCEDFIIEEEKSMEVCDQQLKPCGKAEEPQQQATELVNVSATKLDEPSNTQVTDTIEQEEQEEDEDNTVRCPCEYNEDEGLMILCGVCDVWQHAACFGIIDDSTVPELHICEVCADDGKHQCTDPELLKLSSCKLRANCLWRRTLIAVMEMTKVLPHTLARKMNIDVNDAQKLVNRLEEEGFVKNSVKGKGRSHYKTIQKGAIKQIGFAKYFLSSNQNNKETPSGINHLAQKTSSMTIKSQDQKVKSEQLEDTPLIKEKENVPIDHQKVSTSIVNGFNPKKRARVNDDIEFEIADSQEPIYNDRQGRRKRRKSSIASQSIIV